MLFCFNYKLLILSMMCGLACQATNCYNASLDWSLIIGNDHVRAGEKGRGCSGNEYVYRKLLSGRVAGKFPKQNPVPTTWKVHVSVERAVPQQDKTTAPALPSTTQPWGKCKPRHCLNIRLIKATIHQATFRQFVSYNGCRQRIASCMLNNLLRATCCLKLIHGQLQATDCLKGFY